MNIKIITQVIKAVLTNEDEDLKISNLVKVLKICDDVYYNDGENTPKVISNFIKNKVSDTIYDELIDYLTDRKPNHSYLKKIGAPVSNASSRKVKLPFHMGSLDKVKPGTKALEKLLSKGGPFVVSDKVDGVSLGILPDKKFLCTRGDGGMGQDISHLWNILKLPNKKDKIKIRAEIVMPISEFKVFSKKNSKAKNPRNTVAGLVNKASTDKTFNKTEVITYQIVGMKPSEAFKKLKTSGYKVPFYKVYKNLTEEKLLELLIERKKTAKYEIDGLVVSRDVKEITTSGNPEHSFAFKSASVETALDFIVEDVEWNLSKHGLYKPTIILQPQKLDGVTIKRASGFNAKYIIDNSIGKSTIVQIKRSGGVIPHITNIVKSSKKPLMPTSDYEWNETGVDILLPKGKSEDVVKILRIKNFLTSIGVERIKEGMVKSMFNSGINTIKKVLNVRKSRLLKIDGIQDKTATMIFTQINKAKQEIYLPNLLFGSGCFPRTLGTTRLEIVVKEIPSFLKIDENKLFSQISSLKGFNTKTAKDFITGLTRFKKFYNIIKDSIHIILPKKLKLKSNKLVETQFVFTGVRDKELEEFIIKNGGIISNSISNKTTMLIVKDINTESSKAVKAKTLGVQIKTLEQFKKWINKYR